MAGAVETLIRDAVSKGITKVSDFNRNRKKSDKPNPYLLGIHEPLPSEETLTDLSVTGTIPAELDGRYIRIGPNPITPPNPGLYHWFMGDGMVHGVRLKQGKALWYRNRWIRSRAVSDDSVAINRITMHCTYKYTCSYLIKSSKIKSSAQFIILELDF